MKKFILLLCLFLQVSVLFAGGWQKIYDSGNFGIGKLNAFRTVYTTQKSIFIQNGCSITGGGPPIWCAVVTGSDDYLKLNKSNNIVYIPYGQFLKSQYCVFSIGHSVCLCEPLDFFVVSGKDSMMVLKYYNYYCYAGGSFVKAFITYNGGISNTEFLSGYQLNGCFIDGQNDSVIIMGVNNAIKKSTDRGITWFQISSIPELKFIETGGFIEQNPNMPSYIFAVGNNIMYLSTNYGNSFNSLNLPPFSSISFGQNGNVYGIDSFYLYKSSDYGLNWVSILHNLRPNAFEVSPDNNSVIYLGNNDGLYRSTNGGNNWVLYNNSFLPSYKVIGISKDPNTLDSIYVATTDALYKVWAGGIIDTNIIPDVPLLFSPADGTMGLPPEVTIVWKRPARATSFNVMVSMDSAFSSTIFNSNLTDTSVNLVNLYPLRKYYWKVRAVNHGGASSFSSVWNFKIQGGPMYVGQISPPNNSVNVSVPTALICNKAEIETLLRFKGLDENSSDSLPITYVFDIVRDTVTLNGEMVRYLNDTVDIEANLTGLPKYFWRVRAYNNFGSSTFGHWWNFTTMLIGIKILSTQSPKEFALYINYPNPFNPVTKIKFDIPPSKGARGMTSLIVYDALGREITVLVNERLYPGTYETEWDASNFPSGIYFYKLSAGDFSDTKKMVLIK